MKNKHEIAIEKAKQLNLKLGNPEENWFKSPNILIDVYLQNKIISAIDYTMMCVILRYTKGYENHNRKKGITGKGREFSLSFLASITGFSRQTCLKSRNLLETLRMINVERGENGEATIITPLYGAEITDSYSETVKTAKEEVVYQIDTPSLADRQEVVYQIDTPSLADRQEGVYLLDTIKEKKEKKEKESKENNYDYSKVESSFLEKIQSFAKEVKGCHLKDIALGSQKLQEVVEYSKGDLSILEKKLSSYKNTKNPFIASQPFSARLLLHVWDDLDALDSPPVQPGANSKAGLTKDVSDIVSTPEKRQKTISKYGTF